ncbi:protein KAKU4 isoform X2 [Argentina anserina]|uniref:protein KAKU4 isoform X2 n=1 Tax=Argentina anserina TaxID=57926 RepID=UPI002176751C|nr:protein KAKU4 isoform X2 [Potentilla anserina]
MDSIPRSRQALEPGSGGKIVRTRRPARTRTPYDRPNFTANPPPPENPNWLARFIYSPTRSIVSGAGKVLSSVFRSDSSSSSSSSEIGSDDEEGDDDYVSSQEDDGLNKRNGTSETLFRQGETKHAIEQLLRQETFSREESDKLIKIIKSRVIATTEDAENTRPNMDATDLSATAVSEAKKWVMEKRLGSASKSELGHGTILFPQGAEDDGGSPVDVAKSYMRALPPWASPSQHGELRSTSPLGLQLFNEETPYSIGGTSVTSKPKRDAPATGSWNIQEEIRKVRTKATEEMLRSLPSSKIDWSTFSLENKSTLNSLPDGKQESNLGVMGKTQDGLPKEALAGGTEQSNAIAGETIQYSEVHDQTYSTTQKEVTAHTTNGFPSSAPRGETTVPNGGINQVSSSHEKIVTTLLVEETYELEKDLSRNNEMDIDGATGPDSMPLNETSVEAPNVNENDINGTKENDSAASGSQNSSSMPDELSQELTQSQPKSNNTVVAKEEGVVEKPKAKRLTRYNRRGRSRGNIGK